MGTAELRLMMIEQRGCIYCAAWDTEIGSIYEKTAEGRAAPLMRQELRAPLPDGVTLAAPPVYTPSFILLHNGAEVARLEGYPGPDFFWPMLEDMLQSAAVPKNQP